MSSTAPASTKSRSDVNTSCSMPSADRSAFTVSIIRSMAKSRNRVSHDASSASLKASPYSAAKAAPTGIM